MAKTRVQVKGLKELGAALQALGNDMGRKVARSATGAAATVVKKAWKRNAPVAEEPYKVDGRLVRPGNIGRRVFSTRDLESKRTSEHIVSVYGGRWAGQAYRAAILTEFGTVKMAAQPWARPAFESSKQAALDAMVSRIKTRIDKANKSGK